MKGDKQRVEISPFAIWDFQPTDITTFESKVVEINAESIEVTIPGKETPVRGSMLKAENTDNPNPLKLVVEKGRIQQSATNRKHIFMPEGVLSIGSEKDFEPLGQLKGKKDLKLKVRDPDLLKIDGKEFHQVGTLRIELSNAFIILNSVE